MRRTRVVIQSRLSSSRLPGKAMLTIGGMPLIELVARRASRGGHEVVVATSEESSDDLIADHLSSVGIPVVRGSLDDVLGRFVLATRDLDDDDRVVRLTGDNPMADCDLVDEMLAAMDASGHRYGRVDIDVVPEGLGCEGFDAAALREAAASTDAAYDREHVTPWLRRTFGELLFAPAANPPDIIAYRATVDSLGDYERMARLFRDRADPVGVPWEALMADLVREVDASGPMVGRTPAGMGRVVLSADGFGAGPDPGESTSAASSRLRAIIAYAVTHGVTHVRVARGSGGSEEALRAAVEPAFTKRLKVVSVCAPVPAGDGAAGALEASLERSMAGLGGRSVDVLAFPDLDSARAGWERARAYVADGVVGRLGVLVEAAGLGAALGLTDLAWVEVRGDDPVEAELAAARERGITVVAADGPGSVPRWADAAVAAASTPQEMAAAVTASRATPPRSPASA